MAKVPLVGPAFGSFTNENKKESKRIGNAFHAPLHVQKRPQKFSYLSALKKVTPIIALWPKNLF